MHANNCDVIDLLCRLDARWLYIPYQNVQTGYIAYETSYSVAIRGHFRGFKGQDRAHSPQTSVEVENMQRCTSTPCIDDWFCGRVAPMHLGLMLQALCAPLLVPSVNFRGAPRHAGVRDLYQQGKKSGEK
jgi:hypothetical protein